MEVGRLEMLLNCRLFGEQVVFSERMSGSDVSIGGYREMKKVGRLEMFYMFQCFVRGKVRAAGLLYMTAGAKALS